MTSHRLAYDDAETTSQMASDCLVVGEALPMTSQREPVDTDQLRTDDLAAPTNLRVSDDLAQRASDLELHFD